LIKGREAGEGGFSLLNAIASLAASQFEVICITAPDAAQEQTSIQAAELLNSFTACCKAIIAAQFCNAACTHFRSIAKNLIFLRSETKL
jgi:hypothetical protein